MRWAKRSKKAGDSSPFPETRQDPTVRARHPILSNFNIIVLFVTIFGLLATFVPVGSITRGWTAKLWTGIHVGQDPVTEAHNSDEYVIGVGKADITGPCIEINLMGYADPHQIGTGLRQRLYSRAFIVADPANPSDTFVYLVLDTQSGDTAVRYGILSGLHDLGPEYENYGHHNLAVTGTHSHSGPGAWLNYLLPQITSKGFDRQSYRAIVDGAILSIRRAHENLAPGRLSVGSTKVFGANINRSLFAYLANPEDERARYNVSSEDDGSVDKDLTLLKFQRISDGKNIGVLTWFPTHGTSVLGNNTLISGDNKGVAAYLFEKSVINDETAAKGFVAGFSQANVGDTSPNVLGAWCEDGTGQMCSFENSTCSDGRSQKCHARGPFFRENDEGTSSCFEIGKRQFEPARKLYDQLNSASNPVHGGWVKAFHTFHNMSNHQFQLPNGTEVMTCPAALGYSFAAGTSDGPGAFDFTQHSSNPSNTSPIWRVVGGMLKAPSKEQIACHAPKPILLDVGEVYSPYQWTPNVVDVQVFRVGQLVIIVSPGEATTMAGRRWRNAVSDRILSSFADETQSTPPVVVLGGPANSYTHYISTEEEYGIQRYEGASTLYGPHTLAAYINVTLSWIPYLSSSASSRPPMGPEPPDNSNRSLSFIPQVIHDSPPLFKKFGQVKQDVEETYQKGRSVTATFVGANPRNNLRLERSYAVVEKLTKAAGSPDETLDAWNVVRDDRDWHLVFRWRRTSELLGTSEVEVTWETTDPWAEPGRYRIRYFGDAKNLAGKITEFEGVSGEFELVR
ncbi:Neutral/alkaline nonlysosomal ceramidase [Annulohypoxylon maeteangense]|uniref:Neutral/alkaline nonlysosomal ceramidase n=1 Tax=Annulohypoxylon maeteangense TaxID=1927788 RepID=UPI0020079314|nr:Neutral/alkaline nonlysosomal ceramidase [Annulohypoxylon maeteangense]KAI0885422.1 Neutral/alkaline nonlysosomal ceramidase [Annulohypoxylon maeteangense]